MSNESMTGGKPSEPTRGQAVSAPGSGVPAPASRRTLRARARRWLVGTATVLLLGVPVGVYSWVWLAFHYTYSNGDRAGYVQKFSRKGWICKTWEGEMAMISLPGVMPEIFRFTVRDDVVAASVNQTLGQRVALKYEQHIGLPTTCWGETDHFVVSVRPAGQ
jgi:hypothetical protein